MCQLIFGDIMSDKNMGVKMFEWAHWQIIASCGLRAICDSKQLLLSFQTYRDCPSAGEPVRWSMTCIWVSSGANIPTSALPRLKWTKHLNVETMHSSHRVMQWINRSMNEWLNHQSETSG